MTNDSTPSKPAPDLRAQRRGRRETGIARREPGNSCSRIAKIVQASAATVRREIDRALADRPLDAPERFARAQIARLVKALRLAEAAVELGELKAVETYLRIVAALDRYHELAAGSPTPLRSTKAQPRAPLAPPKELTFVNPSANHEPTGFDEARGTTEEPER
jgi:hypothetical protein